MAPKYKITYFNFPALAEPIRWLFSYGGIEFEDFRFSREQWPTVKANIPYGQVPILEIDGKIYNQSSAICRYVAKLVKLAGKNDLQAMEIDAMVDNISDLRLRMSQYGFEKDEAIKESRRETLVNEFMPNILGKLDAIAKKNNGYFVNSELTWADIYFASFMELFNFLMKCDITEKYPNLQKVNENVRSLPGIKAWIAKRPQPDEI